MIGGLLAGMLTTLFVVPSLYSLVVGRAKVADPAAVPEPAVPLPMQLPSRPQGTGGCARRQEVTLPDWRRKGRGCLITDPLSRPTFGRAERGRGNPNVLDHKTPFRSLIYVRR